MTATEIQTAILEALRCLAPEADPRSLQPEEDLRQTLDIDSFDFLNLLVGLNTKLGVEIPEAHCGQLGSLRALVDYLVARTA